jgi:hypothetical protein
MGRRTRACTPLMKARPDARLYLSSSEAVSRAWRTDAGSGAFMAELREQRSGEQAARQCRQKHCAMSFLSMPPSANLSNDLAEQSLNGDNMPKKPVSGKTSAAQAAPAQAPAGPCGAGAGPLRHRHPAGAAGRCAPVQRRTGRAHRLERGTDLAARQAGWKSRATSPAITPKSTAARSAWVCWPSCAWTPSAITPSRRARWNKPSAHARGGGLPLRQWHRHL